MKTSRLLIVAAAALFLGRGLQGLLRDFPLRTLLWSESLMTPLAERLGYSWTEWVTSSTIDNNIQLVVKGLGLFFIFAALVSGWSVLRGKKWGKTIIFSGGSLFFFLIILWTKDHFWRFGYFLEHALQLGAPFLLWLVLRGENLKSLLTPIRVLTALTFIGHGLFAVGYYPVPNHFLMMTLEGLGDFYGYFTGANLTESAARFFLLIVGILDFIAAGCLLWPGPLFSATSTQDTQKTSSVTVSRRIVQIGLYWIIPWAILTTLARFWSNASLNSTLELIYYWTPEVLFRLPHILLPLLLWKVLQESVGTSLGKTG